MGGTTLIVHLTFRGGPPSDDWLDDRSSLFVLKGEWWRHGKKRCARRRDRAWHSSWACDVPPCLVEAAGPHLVAVAKEIEAAWEREPCPA